MRWIMIFMIIDYHRVIEPGFAHDFCSMIFLQSQQPAPPLAASTKDLSLTSGSVMCADFVCYLPSCFEIHGWCSPVPIPLEDVSLQLLESSDFLPRIQTSVNWRPLFLAAASPSLCLNAQCKFSHSYSHILTVHLSQESPHQNLFRFSSHGMSPDRFTWVPVLTWGPGKVHES